MANTKPRRAKKKSADFNDNPEWTAADFKRAKPAAKVAPAAIKALSRGRPRILNAKVRVSLRIDPDVVEGYKSLGPRWQSRINEILRHALLTSSYGRRRTKAIAASESMKKA